MDLWNNAKLDYNAVRVFVCVFVFKISLICVHVKTNYILLGSYTL